MAMDYKDGGTMFKIMQIIKDLRLRYYLSDDCTVMTFWNGGWKAWHEVMVMDKRLEVK